MASSLVSATATGTAGNLASDYPSVSADGRYVAFESSATNLTSNPDANNASDIYVRDLTTGATQLVSVSVAQPGHAADAASQSPVISANGQYVAFESSANDLVSGVSGAPAGHLNVYVRDLVHQTTHLVSITASGAYGNGNSYSPSISASGGRIAFYSDASNLAASDTNAGFDVFVRDITTSTTTLVSANSAGTATGNAASFNPVISADGSTVAFESQATNLTANSDPNGNNTDVFVRNLAHSATTLVSVTPGGTTGNAASYAPALSANGNVVVFTSSATNLLPTAISSTSSNVYERNVAAKATVLVSGTSTNNGGNGNSFEDSVSADGSKVAFASTASNLVGVPPTGGTENIFVRNLVNGQMTLASVNPAGTSGGNAQSDDPILASSGNAVAFVSKATNLVANTDTNGALDVFERSLIGSTTELISSTPTGSSGNQQSFLSNRTGNGEFTALQSAMSANGGVLGYVSNATNLTAASDANNATDVFVYTQVPAVVDHGHLGYSETGTWASPPAGYNNTGYDGNAWRYAAGTNNTTTPTATATWLSTNLAPGWYDVQASWFASPNRADNAPYLIYDGNTLVATVRTNQRAAPTGPTYGGVAFSDLGSFPINSGTMRVVLANDADGYVVADAVHVATAALPATIDHGQAGYAENGTWSSSPALYAATGYNDNGWRYIAGNNTTSPPTAFAEWRVFNLAPGGYDVQASWYAYSNRATNAPYMIYDGGTLIATVRVNQQLAPSGASYGGVGFQDLGTFPINSGSLSVVLGNDANGYVIADALHVSKAALPTFESHNQVGYSETGTWASPPASYNSTGYEAQGWRDAAGTNTTSAPTATATWLTTGLAPGSYDVQASWYAYSNRATNAPYMIYDGNTLVAIVRVNQKVAPTGPAYGGVTFADLGSFTINSGTLKVVLANDANGYVVADTVHVFKATPPTILDHGQPGYAEAGAWTSAPSSYNNTGYNDNGWRYAAGNNSTTTPTATATWQFNGLASRYYDIKVSWYASANRATNAPYLIYNGNTLIATVRVNQQIPPSGTSNGGVIFQDLGSYAITSGTLRVVLGNDANGFVIADAVRID